MVTYLQLHHNVVELVVPSAANEFTDVVFTWTRRKRRNEEEEKKQNEMIKEKINKQDVQTKKTIEN